MTPITHRAYFTLPDHMHRDAEPLELDPRAYVDASLPALAAWIDHELATHHPNGSNDR
jgi:hypothetical protein